MQAGIDTVWVAVKALPDWQGFLVVVTGAFLLAVLLRVGGDHAIERLASHIPGETDDVVFTELHRAVYVSVAIAGAYAGVSVFDVVTEVTAWLRSGSLTVVTLVWALTLVRIGRELSKAARENRYVDQQVVPIFQNVWTAAVVGTGAFLVLAYWEVDVTPLLASAGVAGVIVGLAARDTIANLFGSIALYLDGTYTVGDFVVLETGERGRVEDISVRSTVIRTREDILVTVPNAELNGAAIVNESTPKHRRRITLGVGVAYGSDVDQVERILYDVAESNDRVLDRPAPKVRFREFGGSSLNFELWCWIPSPAQLEQAEHELNTAIYRRFREEGVEIPFPQRDVNVSVVDDPGVLTGGE